MHGLAQYVHLRAGQSAFTLIELSLCLLIVGVAAGVGTQFVQKRNDMECYRKTQAQLQDIRHALVSYGTSKGRLPRPAGAGLNSRNEKYGTEVANADDSTIARAGSSDSRVLIGALPHSTLRLPPDRGSDCWGNKLGYAVSESYTTANYGTNPYLQGNIVVKRGRLSAAQTMDSTIGYAVISHGADALGANPADYQGSARHCNEAAADPSIVRIDKENCDLTNNILFISDFNNGDNPARFFDDVVVVGGNPDAPAGSCASQTVNWGNCSAPALLTLNGLSLNVTNIAAGYTGLALSTCNNGTRTTLGLCLPIGACSAPNPRTGQPMTLLTGIGMNFGTGVCKKYACCNGSMSITALSPCILPADLPGISIFCPAP